MNNKIYAHPLAFSEYYYSSTYCYNHGCSASLTRTSF